MLCVRLLEAHLNLKMSWNLLDYFIGLAAVAAHRRVGWQEKTRAIVGVKYPRASTQVLLYFAIPTGISGAGSRVGLPAGRCCTARHPDL